MATLAGFTNALNNSSSWLLITATPICLVVGALAAVHVYTTSRYHNSLSALASPASTSKSKAQSPPPIPYTIPWLGHAIAFLAPRPGEFWSKLFQSHPRSTGACTLLLGGNKIHILFSPSAIQTLFRTRGPNRDGFNLQVQEKGLGVDHSESIRYSGIGEGPDHTGTTPVQQQENIHHKYFLEKKSVNELTAAFTRVLRDQLEEEVQTVAAGNGKVVSLYAWLQDRLFKASTSMFMGSRLLEMYPNLREDFFDFDRHMLTMFFRVPRFLSPTPYNVRERALDGLTKWQRQMQKECGSEPADPDGDIDWEPVFGCRANRARQRYYASRGLNTKTRAGMDLGLLFGLSSNAIPAAGWMLMHILNPRGDPTLYGRVMKELRLVQRNDGSLDILALVALPLLQSVFQEVLRLYVDVLVTRELKQDLMLPIDDGKRQMFFEKDSVIMAPSWLGHRDEHLWIDPPSDQFFAERFLAEDPETSKEIFSTSGTGGKLFPFGGGKTICPGRVFAKQEVLASVAMVLLSFEFEFQSFVDEQGSPTKQFPGLRNSYSGSGIMAAGGDMNVVLKTSDLSKTLNDR